MAIHKKKGSVPLSLLRESFIDLLCIIISSSI